MHDRGNEENIFDRFDFKPSEKNTINLNFQFTRSWFQTPNSYDAQDATAWTGLVVDNGGLGPNGLPVGPTDQRSQIKTFDIAPTWTRLLNNNTVFTLGGWMRRMDTTTTRAAILSPTSIPIFSSRPLARIAPLTNAGGRAEVSYVKGINNIKAGVVFQHTFLTEDDSFGVVDPTANAPCLNADGSSVYQPGADRSGELHRRRSTAESEFYTHPGLLRLDPNGAAAVLRRLPEYHQRLVPL